MPGDVDQDALRDWHRLFGLLLTDFFTRSPFTVEVAGSVRQAYSGGGTLPASLWGKPKSDRGRRD